MDALRVRARSRLAPLFEWVVAALFLSATVAVGSMIVRELDVFGTRNAQAAVASSSPRGAVVSSIPASVPARAVSVPVLPFADGTEIRVGDTFSAVAARLGRAAESGRQELDRGSLGERLTRFYEHAGSRFILVFEPFERNGEARVAAIYLP